MKVSRTASRARNGIVNSTNFKNSISRIHQDVEGVRLIISSNDVPEFGNPKTHYDYEVSMSLSELVTLIESAANAKGEIREAVKKEIGCSLGQLIKLINLCAE